MSFPIRYRWKWSGFDLRIVDLADIYPNQSNWSLAAVDARTKLTEDISWYIDPSDNLSGAQKYNITFTINQIKDNANQWLPARGKIQMYIADNDFTQDGNYDRVHFFQWTQNATSDSSGGPFGTFEIKDVIFTPNTIDSTPYGQSTYANSIVFKAEADGNNEMARFALDNVQVERVITVADQAQCEVRVNSVLGIPPSVSPGEAYRKYTIDLFDQEEKLFEFKFPRFAYRYKYLDGEYSAFSPWTQPVFAPGGFDYHPQKGYNLAMTNKLKYISLTGLNSGMPADVVSVDILYKEDGSNNVYIVDTIKDLDIAEYKITSETLKNGITQSNQLLRHWDNVPKAATAQEIVGNRLVYGNYLQNYDLKKDNGIDYKVDLFPEILSKTLTPGAHGIASIKSLREYQLGIVYADKYGRQTPVLTNENATVSVGKNKAENANELRITINNTGIPVNMEYFKFYIKDNTNEYYNLAMDRYYNAEDDNIWIAFPSSDRNKVDIDDFLILKKGVGSNKLIKETARYKIIDIKNEAPENIKRVEFMISTKGHDNLTSSTKLFSDNDLPFEGDDTFQIEYDRVSSSSISNLHNDFNSRPKDKYFITISNSSIGKVTERYELIALNVDDPDSPTKWNFTLKVPLGSEINEFTNDPTGINPSVIVDNTFLNIYKSTIDDNLKFDGRFFVKIYNDEVFVRNIVEPVNLVRDTTYKSVADGSRKIYGLETEADTDRILKHVDPVSKTPRVFHDKISDITQGATDLSPGVMGAAITNTRSWRSYLQSTNEIGEHMGTLNELGSFGVSGTDTGDAIGSRWQLYDAYFRGFNVDPDGISSRKEKMDIHGIDSNNQSFEDVWFFDKGWSAGQFENSNNSPSSGWDSLPNPGNGYSSGIKNDHSGDQGAILDIGFGGIQPNEWATTTERQGGGYDLGANTWGSSLSAIVDSYLHQSDASFYNLEETNLNYTATQAAFIKNIAVGSQFRFKEDPLGEIYTIVNVDIGFKLRYEDIYTGLLTGGNKDFVDNADANSNQRVLRRSCYPLQVLTKNGKRVNAEQAVFKDGSSYTINASTYPIPGQQFPGPYHTSTFLRASNFTKNFRITVDKKLTWNPWENTTGALTNGQVIECEMVAQQHGNNWVDLVSINEVSGSTTIGPSKFANQQSGNIFSDTRRIELGMVITHAPNGDEITAQENNGQGDVMYPMVSKIEDNNGSFRVYFKNYNGGKKLTGLSVAGGLKKGTSGAGDKMKFYQFPVNGLSPNSAKNLNYFRNTMGHNANAGHDEVGTDALGYTIEFVEEITIRPDENVLPENPAVWETEPKKLETDLDIYHAISDFYPIKIADPTDFAPIGSVVQHENSNAIPPGTTITNINPSTHWVELSRDITIDPDNVDPTNPTNWGGLQIPN
tara:strand:- start:1364 stop:5524 length:4161 start_codon:yes stop_codon:yes gene_type:complete